MKVNENIGECRSGDPRDLGEAGETMFRSSKAEIVVNSDEQQVPSLSSAVTYLSADKAEVGRGSAASLASPSLKV